MQKELMGCSESIISDITSLPQIIKTRGQIAIYYGTTSGTSSRLSYQFAQEAQQQGFQTKIINLSEFDPNVLRSQKLAIFIVATYGTGGPTGDAEQFHEWLVSSEKTSDYLKGLKYIVFALGNSNYETFCGMGLNTDIQLESMGGQRIYSTGKGNAQNETTEKDFDTWKDQGLWKVLSEQFPIFDIDQQDYYLQQAQFQIKFVEGSPRDLNQITDLDQYQFQCQSYLKAFNLPIKQIYEMKKNASLDNSTIFIDLDASQIKDNGIIYQTAGNLVLYCQNDEQSVLELCKQLSWEPNKLIDIKSNPYQEQTYKLPFPSHITVKDYLTKFCDILGIVSKSQMYELSKLVKNTEHQKELEFLYKHHDNQSSSYLGRDEFEEKILNNKQNLLTLLKQYGIVDVSIQSFVEIIQPLRPRLYTMASSVKKNPNNIHLVISSFKIMAPENQRLGVCSQYIQDLLIASHKQPQVLKVDLSNSSFIFPREPMVPCILIGPGAGLAPMRALIQERDYFIEQDQLDVSPFQGPMTLYFGCRTTDEYLFEDELKEYLDSGTLSELHTALSRQGPDKVYVTDLLAKDLQALNDFFFEMKGVMYICGSNKMGKDICNLVEKMFKKIRKVPPYMAYKQVTELEKNNQIIKELWG